MPNKPVIYWDSCMFFEVLCNEQVSPEQRAAVDEILQDNKDSKNTIMTSVVTHMECVPSKLEYKSPGTHQDYLALFDGLHFIDAEVSANIIDLAREIKEFYYTPPNLAKNKYGKIMDTGDAIHLATAIIYKVDEFHTRDNISKGTKVPLVDIYKFSGASSICGKHALKIVSPESRQGVLINVQRSAKPA